MRAGGAVLKNYLYLICSMVTPQRIAVISDLHIGTKARALDLCPHELPPEKKVGKTKDFLKSFREYVESAAFISSGPVDHLVITGDISNQADPLEFRLAHKVMREIAESLKVRDDHVHFVPGNHDVHWPVMELTPLEFWGKYRYEPLLEPGLIFKQRMDQAKSGEFHNKPHFVIWTTPGALIVALNTAAFDAPVAEHGKHHGLVTQEALTKLDLELSSIPIDSFQIRICLLHHHPVQYSDLVANYPDYSALTNAGNLLELFSRHQIDIAVHGHKHVPHLQHVHAVTNGHPLTILGAGSFSAELESQWTGATHNQFHVINVEGRNSSTQAVYGYVATWNFEITGEWKASYGRTGLGATEGFGSLNTQAEIIAEISPAIDAIFADLGNCPWDEVLRRVPSLAHVNNRRAFEAFDSIAKAKDLRMFGDKDATGSNWVLLRKGAAS